MKRKPRTRKVKQREGRRERVHRKLEQSRHPRLTVFRSARHIYAQLDDPVTGRTLGTVSTRSSGVAGAESHQGKVERAKQVGRAVAALARERRIERVVFNRNGFLYHGRVKALAEAAREAGLRF
jgi:large subunit ribosomal protein L18